MRPAQAVPAAVRTVVMVANFIFVNNEWTRRQPLERMTYSELKCVVSILTRTADTRGGAAHTYVPLALSASRVRHGSLSYHRRRWKSSTNSRNNIPRPASCIPAAQAEMTTRRARIEPHICAVKHGLAGSNHVTRQNIHKDKRHKLRHYCVTKNLPP